ncbi:MAG: L,D-transpeptidase family protein [Proteobacteria bacterium]|nr:L,D-transpeptidase family protein [Pseudomonadota bacterium]MBU0967220.1 L,D-transpeptidase family protein [Pseudomonadota bacterium]
MFTRHARMIMSLLMCSLLTQVLFSAVQLSRAEEPQALTATDLIKERFTNEDARSWVTAGEESVYSFDMAAVFYRKRDFQPAWTGSDNRFPQADALLSAIHEADLEGLPPEYYHIKAIALLLGQLRARPENSDPDPAMVADLDVLLTDTFLLLSCHLSNGCINPIMLKAEWFAHNEKKDVTAVLEKSLRQNRIKETLSDLTPKEKLYTRLRQGLAQYRLLATQNKEWPLIAPAKPPFKQGTHDKRIPAIRQRLAILGDLPAGENMGDELFDAGLAKAVLSFQKRHGLDADGVIGAQTFGALNVSPAKRVRQIEINLERLRWSFRNPGKRYLLVNIANFALDVVDEGTTVLTMPVVVGKPFWNTPVFSRKMSYVVLNPSWNIPRSIAVEEILPKIRKDHQYLFKNNIRVLQNGNTIDDKKLQSIAWSRLNIDYFPYQLRQDPGPRNPLGSIKFIFPNQFDVYLHDSPHKGLFQRNVRAFSHGCIRIEKPVELAVYLLRDSKKWTREQILAAIKEGNEQTVNLPQPVPVHLIYLTAWVDDNNILQFRDDIYGRDIMLDESLPINPPTKNENNAKAP